MLGEGSDTLTFKPDEGAVRELGERRYGYLAPGMDAELRVTTDPRLYEDHAESMELWPQGSTVLPDVAEMAGEGEGEGAPAPACLVPLTRIPIPTAGSKTRWRRRTHVNRTRTAST